jgi:tyrosine-protein kinase Etk/Wzc
LENKISPKKSGILDSDGFLPVLKFISKNWIFIPIFCSISFVFAYFYSHRLPDVFGAKAEILLKSNQTHDYQNKIFSNLGYYSVLQDITNQKRVITSKDLVGKVIDKLNFNISYFIVGRIKTAQVENFGALNLEIDWKTIMSRLYNTPFFIKVIDENNYQLSFELNGVKFFRELKFNELHEENWFKLKLGLASGISPEEMETIKEQTFKFIIHKREYLINKYASAINITTANNSSIMSLSLSDGLAAHAEQFLDTLTKEYIAHTIENQIEVNENTLKFIDKQIAGITEIIDSLESKYDQFNEDHGILDLTKEQQSAFEQLSKNESEIAQLQLKLKSLINLESYFQNVNSTEDVPPININSFEDPHLTSLVGKIFEIKQRKVNLLIDVKPIESRVARLDAEFSTIITSIKNYLRDTKQTLESRIKNIKDSQSKIETTLQHIPKNKRELFGIERKLTVNEGLYNFLLEKRANTIIARAGIIPETSIVEKSRSTGVVGPDRGKYTYLAIAIGFVVSILVGLIRTIFFERIENIKELKSLSVLPIIGGVPHYEESDDFPIAIDHAPRSNISESFRSIRTNLQYLLPEEGKKRLLVSSLHPGEGKTFTAVNLAATLAKAGKRVVILDFDMHKPKIHKVFKLQNTKGVSSIIVGQIEAKEAIINTQISNLDLILAGPVPPNASELVLSKKVDHLIDEMEEMYDFVIIDTPPLALISDSLVLLNKVQLSVFVLNTQKATNQGVKFLEEVLMQNEINHVTLLLNNIRQNKWRYYYSKYAYKYGYGYVYGYGYGYGDGYRYGYSEYSEKNKD